MVVGVVVDVGGRRGVEEFSLHVWLLPLLGNASLI
jgi:hypothetical protein